MIGRDSLIWKNGKFKHIPFFNALFRALTLEVPSNVSDIKDTV